MHQLREIINYCNDSWLVKGILSLVSTVFTHLFGVYDLMMKSLVTLMVLDLIAKIYKISKKSGGFIKAIKKGKIRSKIMGEMTMFKVVKYAITLAAANQLSTFVHVAQGASQATVFGIPIDVGIRAFFIGLLCLAEFTSILETIVDAGDSEELEGVTKAIKESKDTFFERLIRKAIDQILDKVEIMFKERSSNNTDKEDDK